MFLVKIIDVVVAVALFLFRGEGRRNPSMPLILGTVGIVLLVVGLLAAVGLPRGWYVLRTSPYTAEMANASGLSGGDPVYVAGVPAGRVENIELAGTHVDVEFRLDDGQPLGNQTTATVRLKTVLGKRYLEVVPGGVVDDEKVIPLSRTTVPYSLDEVSADATDAAQNIDVESLEAMMTTLTQVMPNDPDQLGRALAGMSGASAAFARNGEQVDQLLSMSRNLSDLAVRQSESLTTTAANAQAIVGMLAVRRQALSELVDNLTSVTRTLAQSFTDNQEVFGQMVSNLEQVTATLERNLADIDAIMTKVPPSLRKVTDATGNGNWADVTSPSAVIPDNLLCVVGVMQGCR
ncbi:MCE family protein [Rhodococcus sp. HNM0569]|uniref:MCE family protein n=1 Tax=Rhodococcus sp. HNM0569 TaxID=2716340 RepID=UPI00146BAF27|nr:MCE family protein [Rhodococcus sp. HNM0569]NLU81704.1 MCE family protein [Rhodococcus sp. HNM0569]